MRRDNQTRKPWWFSSFQDHVNEIRGLSLRYVYGHPPPHMSARTGERAELAALRYLESRGLALLQRNWRTRFGEIDLVLQDGGTIVFVEVRMRSNPRFGGPGASIDHRKRSRLIASARLYATRVPRAQLRIDAVLIEQLDPPRLQWIRDAVSA